MKKILTTRDASLMLGAIAEYLGVDVCHLEKALTELANKRSHGGIYG